MEAGSGGGDGEPDSALLRGASGLVAGRPRVEGEAPTGDRPLAPEQNHQQQQQQPPKQLIRWERFLPRRSLRVLLVEHDDSTRHIVAALLRKCSYQVTAVADGLKAWDVLKEKEYKIDLVLTEVEMPSLSGIDLLSQITGCDLTRNIPVIMMSSQDSVSIVFDCMRKGAVDFLVKPVRRNELRNLWQHVWRKHCSSSTHGLESTNNQTKSEDISRNDAAINRMNVNVNGIKNQEVCDEGSDTQSSGSKPETSGQHVKIVEPIANECRSSIPMEKSMKKQYDEKETVKKQNHDGHRENKQLTVGRDATSVQDDACSEKHQQNHEILNARSSIQIQGRISSGNENTDRRSALPASFAVEAARSKPSREIIDFIGAAANGECSSAQEKDDHRERFQCEAVESNHDINPATTSGMLSWELSLRGPDMNNSSKLAFQEKHILKHSSASAFSRYGKGIQVSKSGTGQVTLSMTTGQPDKKLQTFSTANEKDEAALYLFWSSPSSAPGNGSEVHACHQVSSLDNKDVGPPDDLVQGPSREDPAVSNSSLDKNNHSVVYHPGQIGLMPLPFPVGGIPLQSLCTGYGAILPPVFYSKPSQHGSTTGENSKDMISPNQMNEGHNHLAYDHPSTQDHRPFHYEVKNDEEPREPRVLVCSSNGPTDQGALHSRNIHSGIWSNGSGETTDAVGNSGMVTDNGNDNGFQNSKGLDWDRSRREAALLKFRMKRKDRCFEKKVRYHSRKKLAEQRPRIKGQFVRRSAVEMTAGTTEEDD